MLIRKAKGGMRLVREVARWQSFRRSWRALSSTEVRLQRLDYLPSDYLMLLGSTAPLTRAGPVVQSGSGWRKDTVSGRLYSNAPTPFIKLRYGRGTDPKVPWENSSFRWAVRLAASRQGDSSAFEKWADLVGDWARNNPPGMGINWLSPMECSRRAVNLALAASLWWQQLVGDDGLNKWLARTILAHAELVSRNPEARPGGLTTNHTSANYCGLLTCAAAIPGYAESANWVAQAAVGLEACVERQVRRDGMTFEGSIPYHFYVLDIFAHASLLLRKVGFPPSERYLDLLRGQFRFLFDVMDSRGNLPQIGDDDSGEWITPRCAYMPAMMASLYRAIFGALPGSRPAATARSESGVTSLKRGDLEALVAACPPGQEGLGGHNHEDILQLCFSYRGMPVLIDPGSGSYSRDLARRSLLRSMLSHNGPVPDGADHYYTFPSRAPFDLVASKEISTRIEAREKAGRTGAVAKAELEGRALFRTVTLTRSAVEVSDHMLAGNDRTGGFTVRLTLDPRWMVSSMAGDRLKLSTESCDLEFEASVPVTVENGLCSPRYDSVVETSVLCLHADSPRGILFRFGSEPGRMHERG
jgi:hypothetical protein